MKGNLLQGRLGGGGVVCWVGQSKKCNTNEPNVGW
jgi:hypothetical protein